MADITRLSRLLNGVQRQVDLSGNTMVVDNLKVKMGSGNDANHATFSGTLTAARTITMPNTNVDLGDIATNNAKVTNVSTDLSEGTSTETTVDVNSSDGSNATLASASTSRAGLLTKAKFDEIVANNAKISYSDAGVVSGHTTEIDKIEAALGASVDSSGDYVAHSGKNYINGNADVTEDIIDLDAAIKTNADSISSIVGSGLSLQGSVDASAISTQLDDAEKGWFYIVTVAGTLFGTNPIALNVGDNLICETDQTGTPDDGADWIKIDNTESPDILRTSHLASTEIFVGNGSGVATAVSMSGEASLSNAGAITLANSAVIAKVLTGYSAGAGTVSAADSILAAIQKLDGNIAAISDTDDQTAAEVAYTQATVGDWTIADGSNVDVTLDEVGSRLMAIEADSDSSSILKTMVAGETFAATTVHVIRMAVNGETDTRVYKADDDATSTDKFHVIGLAYPAAEVAAGSDLDVVLMGEITSSVAFTASQDEGKAVYLGSAGVATLSPSTTANDAVVKIGMVSKVGAAGTAKILVSGIQIMGVN